MEERKYFRMQEVWTHEDQDYYDFESNYKWCEYKVVNGGKYGIWKYFDSNNKEVITYIQSWKNNVVAHGPDISLIYGN